MSISLESLKNTPRGESADFSNEASRKQLIQEHKINESEYETMMDIAGRVPTMAELGVFSSMWSEHCSYKSSKVHLSRLLTEGEQVVVGPGENAGVVHIEDDACIAFKMESHNHPSFLAPYQGAATGVGGILRDVFCMGARPIANLNCLRFGNKSLKKTKYLLDKAVDGIGDYGNCVGIPTVGGQIEFDDSYNGNCLVNAMTIGLIDKQNIFKGYASGVGNYLIYAGSATGRDGIHGATMASDSFDSSSSGNQMTIQVGDPFAEKILLEATLELLKKNLVVGLQDMGAAGLTSSSFEMADRANMGLFLNLDKVPVRASQMTAYELLLSESQERMLFVIKPSDWDAVKAVLSKWEIAHDLIGEVTDTKRLQATYQGKLEVDLPVKPLTDKAPKYSRPMKEQKRIVGSDASGIIQKIKETGYNNLLQKILGYKKDHKAITERYDRHIGFNTVLNSDHGGAAVVALRSPLTSNEHCGVGVTAGCLHRHCQVDPFWGSFMTVLSQAREMSAAGVTPLAITDCLNFGNPENPAVMDDFSKSVDGLNAICGYLNTPVVSGNVSLYNETDQTSIYPTPMIGMVGKIKDYRNARPAIFNDPNKKVYLLKPNTTPNFGGSVALHMMGLKPENHTLTPIVIDKEVQVLDWVRRAKLEVCRPISPSGVMATLSKMILPNDFGFQSNELGLEDVDKESFLFGDMQGGYLMSFQEDKLPDFPYEGYEIIELGAITKDPQFHFAGYSLSVSELKTSFCGELV